MTDMQHKTFEQLAAETAPGEQFSVGSFDVDELRRKLPPGSIPNVRRQDDAQPEPEPAPAT